jgi:hypothetical protein
MKFAVSMALVVLLLGMPRGCILATFHAPAAHPWCPRTTASDSAKASTHVAMAAVLAPVTSGIAPPSLFASETLPHSISPVSDDLYISYRILRI